MLRNLFTRLVTRLREWNLRKLREVHTVRGLRVLVDNTRLDVDTAAVLARLDEALGLIEQHQPWRWRHLQRDVAQLWVARFPSRGAYFADSRTCLIELTFLARRDITAAVAAACVLHEGVHARVDRMRARLGGAGGNTGGDAPSRAREERLCRKAEIAFAGSLPGDLGVPVLERARESLALDDEGIAPTIDWQAARARQEIADVEAGPLPGFLKRRRLAHLARLATPRDSDGEPAA